MKFHYEMDYVFGPLMGINRRYSKIEGILLSFSAYGLLTVGLNDEYSNFLSVIFMQMGNIYFFFCLIYFYLIREHTAIKIVSVMILVTSLSMYSRVFLIENTFNYAIYGNQFKNFSLVCLGICILGGRIMCSKAPKLDKMIRRWVKIHRFCEDRKDFVWLQGKDAPEGFAE